MLLRATKVAMTTAGSAAVAENLQLDPSQPFLMEQLDRMADSCVAVLGYQLGSLSWALP